MSLKIILYLLITPFVVYCMDGMNINSIFKKNKIMQARIIYIMITLALAYLMVNFVFDVIEVSIINK